MDEFKVLQNKTLSSVDINDGKDEIVFTTAEGEKYKLYHSQNCCESVLIEDIEGDMADLIGNPILIAEEVEQVSEENEKVWSPSQTWTFYKLSTIKGSVTIRWLGESNGYYSESVDFIRIDNE